MDPIDKLSYYLQAKGREQPGQQTLLAAHLGVTPGLVWQWLNRRTPIAPERVIGIAAFTGFEITPHEIAPEIYPNPTDGLPPQVAAGRWLAGGSHVSL